jgi:hypothetical protein
MQNRERAERSDRVAWKATNKRNRTLRALTVIQHGPGRSAPLRFRFCLAVAALRSGSTFVDARRVVDLSNFLCKAFVDSFF